MSTEPMELNRLLGQLAYAIGAEREEGGLDAGEKAELRRFHGGPLPLAFWRIAARPEVAALLDGLARGREREDVEQALATILQAMAVMGPLANRDGRQDLGAALAASGYGEARFVRLLRARGRDLVREIATAARWCATKGQPIAWSSLARLVLAASLPNGPFDAERESRHQARRYFAVAGRTETAEG